jgi:hypothetical protein
MKKNRKQPEARPLSRGKTALDKLLRIAPPPKRSPYPRSDWLAAEKRLGIALPSDYKAYVDRYGDGELAGFIRVQNPFPNLADWLACLERYLEADREARENCPEEYAGPIFPEPGGRLPWGGTTNGDVVWWLTAGAPDKWTVIVWETRGPEHQHFNLSAVELLVGWVTGTLDVRVSTDHFIKQAGPTFMPDSVRWPDAQP